MSVDDEEKSASVSISEKERPAELPPMRLAYRDTLRTFTLPDGRQCQQVGAT